MKKTKALAAAILGVLLAVTIGCTPSKFGVTGANIGFMGAAVGITFKGTDAELLATVKANGESDKLARGGDRAVVFGNNYPGTRAALNQCVADAHKNVINLVRIDGFDPAGIRLFLNEQCTKANYEKWSRWALAEGVGGRRAYFNSSHGGEDTGPDGKIVNVVVTYDMVVKERWDETTEVSFDFWYKLLRSTDAPWMFLNDSCHSGGQTKFSPTAAARGRSVRALEGPEVVQKRLEQAVSRNTLPEMGSLRGTVFAVCRADQLANEGPEGGVGTNAYWAARTNLGSNLSTPDIVRESNRLLRAVGERQNMVLIGIVGSLWQKKAVPIK